MATQFYFYSNNAPDAKIILNRGTQFQYDITSDVLNFNTSNDINSMFGNFTVVLDNTNDKHVDEFGVVDVAVMSSIEIFVKSNIAESSKIPTITDPKRVQTTSSQTTTSNTTTSSSDPQVTKTVVSVAGQSLNTIVNNVYGINSYSSQAGGTGQSYNQQYLQGIIQLNLNKTVNFFNGGSVTITAKTQAGAIADQELAGGQTIILPPMIANYKRIFLGVVENVQQSFEAGAAMSITITGESFGYWLRASTVNINPGLNEVGTGSSTSIQNTIYANKYAQSQALDIFENLIQFSSNDTLTVADFSLGSTTTTYENLNSQNYLSQLLTDDSGQPFVASSIAPTNGQTVSLQAGQAVTLQEAFSVARPSGPGTTQGITTDNTLAGILSGLQSLQQSILLGTYLDGTNIQDISTDPNSTNTVVNDLQGAQKAAANYNSAQVALSSAQVAQANASASGNLDTLESANNNLNVAQQNFSNASIAVSNNGVVQAQLNSITSIENQITNQINNKNINGQSILEQLGIIQHWQQIFSQIILEVANASYLQNVYPFKWILSSPQIMDGDYQPKSTIAKQIADALNFEFYVDTNGHFILKPPLYNIGIPNDDPTYIIEQQDITSMNINDTVDGIITRIGVTGDVLAPVQLEREQTYNIHTDLSLVGKYGVHDVELQNLIFLRTAQDCALYGESYMAKANQELRNASVTIMGRPDIRLGVACFLKPRNTVYYIKAISHDFSVGGQYTTTLTLVGGRKIVVGYLASSTVNTSTANTINGIYIRSTNSTPNTNTIKHYILANSLSPSIYAQQNSQIANNNSPTAIPSANENSNTKKFAPVKNAYIIVSNPNIGYIGLIVDQNSTILNDINYNTFSYIYNSSKQAITPTLVVTEQSLQSQFGNNITPFQNIYNYLLDFIIVNNIGNLSIPTSNGTNVSSQGVADNQRSALTTLLGTPDQNKSQSQQQNFITVAQSFNQAILQQYISTFLNYLSTQASLARSGSNSIQLQTWEATASYFNNMVLDMSAIGSYRAYTDGDGREYPALLNYGQGLQIENTQLSMNANSQSQQAVNPTSQTNATAQAIINAANQYLGNTSQANNPTPSQGQQ